jgi:excisionase family DNA binding protein
MYEDWPTIKETIRRTGMSERTLYRRMQDDSLRQAYRKVPGRKPILVLHPEDVERLEAETVKPVALPPELIEVPATVPTGGKPATAGWVAELAAMAKDFLQERPPVRLSEKFMLTLDEAAELSGFSKSYLKRAISEGQLPYKKDRGYKILRDHLWQFAANGSGSILDIVTSQ